MKLKKLKLKKNKISETIYFIGELPLGEYFQLSRYIGFENVYYKVYQNGYVITDTKDIFKDLFRNLK